MYSEPLSYTWQFSFPSSAGIAGKYRINKYPTIKLFRAGNVVKKEYRGQRSVEALVQFAKDQAENPVKEVTNLDDLNNLGVSVCCLDEFRLKSQASN